MEAPALARPALTALALPPSLPSDPNAVPQETEIAAVGGWRFLAMGGVPPITRRNGGRAAQHRPAFLALLLPRSRTCLPLCVYAYEMGRTWGASLDGYPATFLRAPSSASALSADALSDLATAMAVLMRTGLVVVEGMGQEAVTRTDRQVSFRGQLFIRGEEGSKPGLYWPGNAASGVTVGPGYDMGGRTRAEITADLTAVGVSAEGIGVATDAAGKIDAAAGDFARQNKDAIALTATQQSLLFDRIKPRYERLVSNMLPRSLLARLFQHEYDAVFSLAWNTQRFGTYTCNMDMRRLDLVRVIPDWLSLTGGGPGIPGRRQRETMMFRDSTYMLKPILPPNSIMGGKPSDPRRFEIREPSGLSATGGDRV